MDLNKLNKKNRVNFIATGILLLLFILFTAVILTTDVQPIGPEQSSVGLATLNKHMNNLFGVNILWYEITEWTGIITIGIAVSHSLMGLAQLIKRRSFKLIDLDIIVLGAFYVLVAFCYFLFEILIINYRPIIIGDSMEASFPSSHTMVVLCIMATSMMRFNMLLKNTKIKIMANLISISIIAITIIGRMVSGVHWFTDILGSLLLGSTLIMLYYSVIQFINYRNAIPHKIDPLK